MRVVFGFRVLVLRSWTVSRRQLSDGCNDVEGSENVPDYGMPGFKRNVKCEADAVKETRKDNSIMGV